MSAYSWVSVSLRTLRLPFFVDLDGNEMYRHLGMISATDELPVLGEYMAHGIHDKAGILTMPAGESE